MKYLENADISPKKVYAGDSVEFRIKLTVGSDFVTQGSRILLDLPGELGYSRPTRGNPEDPGYVEMRCSNPSLRWRLSCWNLGNDTFETARSLYENKHAQRLCVLDLLGGDLRAGDIITILWGFLRDGFGQGTKVGILVPSPDFTDTIVVRYFVDGTRALPDRGHSYAGYGRPQPDQQISASFQVLPREPSRLRLLPGQTGSRLLVLDRFSNLCHVESLEGLTVPAPAVRQAPSGVFHLGMEDQLSSAGNCPMTVVPDLHEVYEGYSILFGDLHTHSAYSYDCAERERMHQTPADYYRYARDTACLDFLAVTDHHLPWGEERRKIGRENWERTLEAARRYHQPNGFIAFPGLEVKDARGDTTLILGENFSYEEITHPSLVDLPSLWERYRGRNYLGIPHFHNLGSLPAGTWRACPYEGVEPVVEVSSCHGTYEAFGPEEPDQPLMEHERPDRCGRFLLSAGYRYGFICSSDGHKGNPGQNGLTAVFVKERTREAVLDALRQRRAYGTTNARIRLVLLVDGKLMGSVLPASSNKEIFLSVVGEGALQSVEVIANGAVVRRFYPQSTRWEAQFRLQEIRDGYCYVRVVQQDGHRAYSSAVWFQE